MLRKFATVFGTLGVLAAGIVLISIMGQMRPKIERQEPEVTPAAVLFETATPRKVTLDVFAQGEVRPRTDIMLTAQVSGQIIEASPKFVDGGAFDKGDLLIKIEDDDYQYAVTGARSRVAQAKEILTREEAEANLAAQDYRELGADEAATDLALRKPQLAQARASYDAAVADLKTAQLNLRRTRLTAPFEGRVRERLVGPGQFVAPGAQLGRLFATDIAEIRLPLTDADLAKLGLPVAFVATPQTPGPKVEFSALLAGTLHRWTGYVDRTDGAIDPATRQISAIAVVNDPYGAAADNGAPLAMGLFVDAAIEGKPYDGAFIVPRKAIYGRDTLYVVDDNNRLEERTVAIVSSDRNTVTITSGVEAGEKIVVSPLRGAGDGDPVSPSRAAPEVSGAAISARPTADSKINTVAEKNYEPDTDVMTVKASTPAAAVIDRAEERSAKSLGVERPGAERPVPALSNRVSSDQETTDTERRDDTASASPATPVSAEPAPRRYKPGERAPNDEVANDLNRQQLQRGLDRATPDNAPSGDSQ